MEKIVFPYYRPTIVDSYEEGYREGFDDGFDTAMVMENDQEWVVNLCTTVAAMAIHKCASDTEIVDYAKRKFAELMEQKKSGVSAIFDDIPEEELMYD